MKPPSFADEEDLGVPPPPDGDPKKAPPSLLRPLGAMLDDALERADKRARGEEKPIPIPWPGLSEQFGGGLWSGLHVLVAGSAIGKTTWSLQAALHAAAEGYPVVYVGLELDEMQIALRLIGDRAGVAWSRLYIGKAKEEQRARARTAAETLRELPFYGVQGSPSGWSASELYPLADEVRAKHPGVPMLIVLDFLQIVGDEHDVDGSAFRLDLRERIGRAAYVGRDVARTRNASVVLISSAGRDKYEALRNIVDAAGLGFFEKKTAYGASAGFRRVIAQPDAIIGLGKESGEIEYAADTVTVAARYPKELDGETSVLFVTAKNRYGKPSWSELRFNGYRFAEPAKGDDALRASMKLAREKRAKKDTAKPTNGEGTAKPEPEREEWKV